MQVTFYKFTKRVNSTKLPSGSGTTYNCQIKDECSVVAPQIVLRTFTNYNYCYIPDFGRYYFVTNCVINSAGIYTYSLAVDVLGSYKSSILDNTLYIKRSASNYDLFLNDDTWIHDTKITESVTTASNSALSTEVGVYLVTIVNQNASNSANPASTMYAMSGATLALLLARMFDLENYTDKGITDLEATYFNPYQYVTSCKWLPLSYGDISGTAEIVSYGWYTTENINAKRVTEYGKTLTWTITMPSATNWTHYSSEWSSHLLYVPFCGELQIDPCYAGKTLTVTQYIDFNTGGVNAVITDGTNHIISSLNGKCGAEVAISQVAGDISVPTTATEAVFRGAKVIAGAVSRERDSFISFGRTILDKVGTSFAMSYGGSSDLYNNVTIDGGSDVAKSIKDGAIQEIINPTVSVSGSDGSRYTIMSRLTMVLYTKRYVRYVDAHTDCGGMCHKKLKLSTLSGYTQVANGMIELNALDEEKSAIRQMLETAFYIE